MKANLEPLLHPPDSSLVSKLVRLPSFNHPYHFHPEVEITFIGASSGTRAVGDNIGSFHAGELYLLGENLPHVFRNTFPPGNGAEAEVLHFLPGPGAGVLDALPETRAFARLLEAAKAGMVFDQNTSKLAGRLLRQIRQASGMRRLAAFFELAAILLEAPEPRVLASAGGSAPTRQTVGSDRIRRVCSVILENFTEDLTHRKMATLAHMAPASFSRLFLRTTGKTFTQFLTEVRLGHACRLLRETDSSVAGIAFASGFANLANFNRQFRRYHRYTPREYRRVSGSPAQCLK